MSFITGEFTGTGQSDEVRAGEFEINMHLSGTFSATIELQRKFGSGGTFVTLSDGEFVAAADKVIGEPDGDAFYRLNCTAYTSGTAAYRLGVASHQARS